eukprot:TRINITY_DN45318_c0_g1_i1.p1 TRINITY_DN45318_c0_g1~~TRINITY_DN45318_c0_g1_i1.p1  ORF type:complete len:141 (+),score=18.27 TRINITY_DN45318_c0_g1_i1:93-515(+)
MALSISSCLLVGRSASQRILRPACGLRFASTTGSDFLFQEGQRSSCLAMFGLEDTASQDDIKRRYFELAKQTHPDVASREPSDKADSCASGAAVRSATSSEQFNRLKDCYEVLSAPKKKEVPDWLREMREAYHNSKDPVP